MRNDSFDLKMRYLKLEIVDTQRCFLLSASFQNVINFCMAFYMEPGLYQEI